MYISRLRSTISSLFILGTSNLLAGLTNPALDATYVDQANDFTITINAGINNTALDEGDTVTWKEGSADEIPGLIFGTNAFTSIQEAVDNVNDSGTIFIAEGSYNEGSEITITKSLTLQGKGAKLTTLDGNNNHRLINISEISSNITINDLSIINGATNDDVQNGGGIINSGTLILNNSTLSDNSSANNGGSISSSGILTINNSTLSGNSTNNDGGGISNSGTLTVNNSTLSGNTADNDGGGISNSSTLTVNNSTLSNNAANNDGGGIFNVNNLTINNSIVAGNSAPLSPEINGAFISSSSITVLNGIIGDIITPLADNGGPTKTHALFFRSPAINAGDNSLTPIDTSDLDGDDDITEMAPFDQLGASRIIGSSVDIGAVEGIPIIISSVVPTSGSSGLSLDGDIVITFNQFIIAGTGNIFIRDVTTGDIIQTIAITDALPSTSLGSILTITPTVNLPENTAFFIEIEDGAIVNQIGNSFSAGDGTHLSFTTCNLEVNSRVYVDAATDFTITTGTDDGDPNNGNTVTWKEGSTEEIIDLTFGINAFTSVQDAIDNVCADGTVFIADGEYLEGAEISITKSLTLQGDSAEDTYLSGSNSHRVINITGNTAKVAINNLSIINGRTNDRGSGIANLRSTLTINNSTFSKNSARFGGGIYIFDGTLTINNSTLTGNSADLDGGGIFVFFGSSLTVNNSTLSKNSAQFGSGGGIANIDSGILTINNSTLFGNFSGFKGGGIENSVRSTLAINNSILSGNSAESEGGGVRKSISSSLTINSSIIAGNTAPIGPGVLGFFSGTNNITTVPNGDLSSLITPLADNGGPTLTHALVPGGPAINAGDSSLIPTALTTDQRGLPRIINSAPDIGAVEFLPSENGNAPFLRVAEFSATPTTRDLNIASIPARYYQLESSEDLTIWTPLGFPQVTPSTGFNLFSDSGPFPKNRFYRASEVPAPTPTP